MGRPEKFKSRYHPSCLAKGRFAAGQQARLPW